MDFKYNIKKDDILKIFDPPKMTNVIFFLMKAWWVAHVIIVSAPVQIIGSSPRLFRLGLHLGG